MQRSPRGPCALTLSVLLLATNVASAKPEFGPMIDSFCTQQQRVPATPFADGKGSAPLQECQLCHQAGSFDKSNTVEPSFSEFRAARPSGDFSFFCPDLLNANTPPTLDPIGDHATSEGQPLSFPVVARDADGDRLTLAAADLPTGATFTDRGDGTGSFSWIPGFDQGGNHRVMFSVADDGVPMGSSSEQITITVGDVNRLPVLAPVGNRIGSTGVSLTIALRASDPDGDSLAFAVADPPPGAALTDNGDGTAGFAWTPGFDQAGNHALTFSVTDGGVPMASDSEPITITIGDVNRPPVLDPIGARSTDVGVPIVIALTASDPDRDGLRFDVTGAPAGAQLSDFGDGGAEFTWTPAADQLGNHEVSFRVSDDGTPPAADSEAVTLSVGAVNRPPVLAPIGDRSALVGELVSVRVTASDPDGDALVCDALGLPAGAEFTDLGDGTGELRWLPGPDALGAHAVSVTVRDTGVPSEQDSETFGISVEAAPNLPTSDLVLDVASWRERNARLSVRGFGATPGAPVEILDTTTGAVLGRRAAKGDGSFKAALRPSLVPCSVQARSTGALSPPVDVLGAPADCGEFLDLRLKKAEWRCERSELRVEGDRALPRARISIYDADTGEPLGSTRAGRNGKFRYRGALTGAPARIEVSVVQGSGEWVLGPVAVEDADEVCLGKGEKEPDDDEEDDEDDEEEDEDDEEEDEEDDD